MYYGERLNSITHLVGAVLALIALGVLLTVAAQTHNAWVIFSFTIYGVTLVLLYTMSTLYHSFQPVHLKKLFQLFDHVSIYLLIAGTYTPFTLVLLREGSGWWIFGAVWSLAVIGTLSEIFLSGRAVKVVQLVIYLGMGWAIAFDIGSLKAVLHPTGVAWLTAGGIIYTLGVVFYVFDKMNVFAHAHGIWHFFVLVGSVCHFISIILYVR